MTSQIGAVSGPETGSQALASESFAGKQEMASAAAAPSWRATSQAAASIWDLDGALISTGGGSGDSLERGGAN